MNKQEKSFRIRRLIIVIIVGAIVIAAAAYIRSSLDTQGSLELEAQLQEIVADGTITTE